MTDLRIYTKSQSVRRATDDTWVALRGVRDGAMINQPWNQAMIIDGKGYQVKAGNLTSPLTGDIAISDATCEMAVNAASGMTVIPMSVNVSLESFAGGGEPEMACKSAPALSGASAGTVFLPLPLRMGGRAARGQAFVDAAGGVTAPAETVLNTRVHYASVVAAVGNFHLAHVEFRVAPICVGTASFYVQVAADTAGPVYFAQFDYLELPTNHLA